MSINSLKLVPSALPDSVEKTVDAPHAEYGVHDSFRYGLRSVKKEIHVTHPLEMNLKNWEKTQENMKYSLQRSMYGIHQPIRLQMEKALVSQVQRLPVLPSSRLGLEILSGKDTTLDVEDFLGEPTMYMETIDVHTSMEKRLGMKL
ncbi:proteasome maturation factor UMP1-domain-containing protein [Paraphysoderma sedebokerense]|nr:proteasome maturation factor UMP1-domain-containing protein [Paraphysoderma sedebokerense]